MGGSLASGPLPGIGGSLGGGGRMALTLQYRPAVDRIEAVNAEVSANASVSLSNVGSLIAALPPGVATAVRSAVQPHLQGHGQASIDARIKYTAKLLPLITALDAGHTCKLYPQNECLSGLRPAASPPRRDPVASGRPVGWGSQKRRARDTL